MGIPTRTWQFFTRTCAVYSELCEAAKGKNVRFAALHPRLFPLPGLFPASLSSRNGNSGDCLRDHDFRHGLFQLVYAKQSTHFRSVPVCCLRLAALLQSFCKL